VQANDADDYAGLAPVDDDCTEDEDCVECGGDGWITDDCFEDTCCCADPETSHGMIPCPNCNPKGDQ
jgi:hypothetical protein